MLQYFRDRSIRLRVRPESVNEGFLLTPRREGGRYLTVDLARSGKLLEFGFSVPVGDGEFDYELLYPERIYAGESLPGQLEKDAHPRYRSAGERRGAQTSSVWSRLKPLLRLLPPPHPRRSGFSREISQIHHPGPPGA